MSGALGNALPEDLVQRYFDGELDDRGSEQLSEWLAAAPENMKAFVEQLDVHASLWEKSAASAVLPAAPKRTRRSRWRFLSAMSAACLLLGAGIAFWFLGKPAAQVIGRVKTGTVSVIRNERRISAGPETVLFSGDHLEASAIAMLAMADGSTAKLDGGARLALRRVAQGERADLRLERGRIFLRVARAPGGFCVTGSARVRVLGTVFGVEEQDRRTEVDVLEGRVELDAGGQAIEVLRGQSAAASPGMGPALTGADPNVELLWARDLVRFENRPLGEVLDWIEANSTYRFEIPGRHLSAHRVSVAIADEPVREVIEALMLSCGLDYRFDEHDVKVK